MKSVEYERPTDIRRSALMRRVRQHGTRAEDETATILRELGLHYRRNMRSLPGSPDFANKSRKWALFVNGCFWHHHQGCPRATVPTRNREFWQNKFAQNWARDQAKTGALEALGFTVVVVWECETAKSARVLSRLRHLSRR